MLAAKTTLGILIPEMYKVKPDEATSTQDVSVRWHIPHAATFLECKSKTLSPDQFSCDPD